MSSEKISVKVAGHVAGKQAQRENITDAFTYAVNVAPCGTCGTPVTWICGGSKGNANAVKWMSAEAASHCPTCKPDATTGSFRVRTTLPDGDAVALMVNDRIAYVAPATPASVDAVKLALAELMKQLTSGGITPVQYAEAVAVLNA
jgi:hypothetical protein